MNKFKGFIDRFLRKTDNMLKSESTRYIMIGYVMYSLLMYAIGGFTALAITVVCTCLSSMYALLHEFNTTATASSWWVILGAVFAFIIDTVWMIRHGMELIW